MEIGEENHNQKKKDCINNNKHVVSPSASFQHSEDICKNCVKKKNFTKPVPSDCKRKKKPFEKGLDSRYRETELT